MSRPLIVNAGASYRFNNWRWPVEFGGSVRHVGNRFLFEDDATTMLAYTTARRLRLRRYARQGSAVAGLDTMRVTFRVRNMTNAVYAAWSDPGYPDQVYSARRGPLSCPPRRNGERAADPACGS